MVPTPPEAGSSVGSSLPIDPDLVRVLTAWSALPSAIKAGILAMVEAAQSSDA
jgi:hypothetical protein